MINIILGVLIWWFVLGIDWYLEVREGKESPREIAIFYISLMIGVALLGVFVYHYPGLLF